ncbi:MAG: A/G-specific adenine glycosylase, partial [Verrucomicrobiota bacterium]|nr:A/G-specific adenine glycosylase [Verrucomicrobiota bacterium]
MPDVLPVPKPVATRHALRNVRAFRRALLRWFDQCGADYPWRRTTDPYAILVSEVMLQQTTIGAVIQNRRFERFLEEFPDLRALAGASESELLRSWEGLGYYNRVRNLQKTARTILETHGGVFPADPSVLESLPGIGRYTAGAVASFAFDHPAPIVEANITRVLSRLFSYREPIDTPDSRSQLWSWAEALLPPCNARAFNSAFMELGQSHCSP